MSKDSDWLYVKSEYSIGWVPAANVAVGLVKEIRSLAEPDYFIVAIAHKVPVYADRECKTWISDIYMGAQLKLKNKSPSGYNVLVPFRGSDGSLKTVNGWVKQDADVNVGFQHYTQRNVITTIFRLLNRPYDWDTPFSYAYGVAFSPNQNKNAPFVNYPFFLSEDKLLRNEDYWQNYENGFGGLAEETRTYKENFLKLKTITIDYGTSDLYSWIPDGCMYLSELLEGIGISHNLVNFYGGHGDKNMVRMEEHILPFFSEHLNRDGTLSINSKDDEIASPVTLYQNFPNPFNPTTMIEFRLLRRTDIRLSIYNMAGQEIDVLHNGHLEAGEYRYQWYANERSSGVYLYKIITGNTVERGRMLLIR